MKSAVIFTLLLAASCSAPASTERVLEGRPYRGGAWRACASDSATRSRVVPRVDCGAIPDAASPQFGDLVAATRAARDRVATDSSPTTLHTAAIAQLRWARQPGTSLDDAIMLLELAAKSDSSNAAVWNDLAIALNERGARDQDLESMLQALNAVQRAFAFERPSRAIQFNRALILERLYFSESAITAWSSFLEGERDANWRREAEAHVYSIRAAMDTTAWPTWATADSLLGGRQQSMVLANIRRAPERARDISLALLGTWGERHVRDSATSARPLDLVRAIAETLSVVGADRSIELAVRAIDAAREEPNRTSQLARGHSQLKQGLILFGRAAFAQASDSLQRAAATLREARSPASHWASSYYGASMLGNNRFDVAKRTFAAVIADASSNEPAVIGKAYSALGVVEGRQGHYELANQLHVKAMPYIERAKEPENVAALAYYMSENLDLGGRTNEGKTESFRGLQRLSPHRGATSLANHLFSVAGTARAAKLSYAAVATIEEYLAVARRLGRNDGLSFGLCLQAQDFAEIGDAASAEAALAAATVAADSLSGDIAERSHANIAVVRGRLLVATDPRQARVLVDRALDIYRRGRVDLLMPSTLYEASAIAHALRDTAAERSRLEEAIERVERQRLTFGSAASRAALDETVERIYDAAIELELNAGHSDRAFEYLERERNAAWLPSTTLERVRQKLPASTALVEFVVLPRRVVAWVVSHGETTVHPINVSRDSIGALVERFGREVTLTSPANHGARAALFDLLLRPVGERLRGITRLAVVPDRELSDLPFAALWDTTSRKYVVEHWAVLTEQSAAFLLAAGAVHRPASRSARALAIGNPTLDTSVFRLASLPGAEKEVSLIRAKYSNPKILVGSSARHGDVVSAMRNAEIVHFAGHSVFNPGRPELSYLALAADKTSNGMLAAREIENLRLSNLKLVVLSSCTSLAARATRTGAFAGLAYSFLRAGAPASVTTLFEVSDEHTAPLLERFHEHYVNGADGADALRRAQMEFLRRPDGALRPPAEWAAFVYSGS